MDSHSGPLEIFFLPFLAPGHMIPLSEIAQLFSSRGHHVTLITTSSNVKLLHKSLLHNKNKNNNNNNNNNKESSFSIHTIPFPSRQVGLPKDLENFFFATDLDTAAKLYHGMTLLQTQIEHVRDILAH